jgi:hypothetical protein
MRYIEPINDRTALDVTNKTTKAFFNIADWLRVYNNTQVVNALVSFLLSMGITFNAVGEPTITTFPTVTDVNTLLANIERIRLAAQLPAITGLVEITSAFTEGGAGNAPDYLDANDWENALHIILNAFPAMVEYVVFCGVGATGQPRFYQHRFRQYAWVALSASPTRLTRLGFATSGTGLTRNNSFRRYD